MSHEIHRLRQGIYRVLSAGFAPVSSEFLASVGETLGVLDGLGLYDYSFGPEVADVIGAFAVADPGELRARYVELFEVCPGGAVCLVRESAQIGNPRTGEVALILAELTRRYHRSGVRFGAMQRAELDHVATELAAMASLCAAAADRLDDGASVVAVLRDQSDLATEHLLRWIPQLARQVIHADRHPAYTALGAATLGFLEHERQHLPMLITLEEPAPS